MMLKANNLRFAILHGLYWASFNILLGFLVPLYRHYGFSEATIGFLSTTSALASMIIQPLWGILCDRTGKLKGIFVGTILFSILLSYGLWLGKLGAIWMFPVVFLIAATYSSMGTVLDSWIMKMSNQGHNVRYNITRGIGSISFAVMAIVYGRVLDAAGMTITPFVFTGMALLLAVFAVMTRAPAHVVHMTADGLTPANPLASFGELLKNQRFVLLIVSLMLVFAGNGAAIVFMPVRMAELGGTNAHVGFAMMVMALSEAPAMLLYHRIAKKFRIELLLTVSLFFFIVKIVVLALSPNVTLLIMAQMFQFLSFGLYMPSVIHHLNHIVLERQLTTALLLFASGTFGLGMMIGSSTGGLLAERFGVQTMLLILACVTACGFIMHLITTWSRPATLPFGSGR